MLEGVAYEYAIYLRILRELHPEIDLHEVRVVGGGARSHSWNAIKASVLGVPYARLARGEFSCWGAALVAGKAIGLFDDLAAAAGRATEVEQRFAPDPAEHDVYVRQAAVYARLLDALGPAGRALASRRRGDPSARGDSRKREGGRRARAQPGRLRRSSEVGRWWTNARTLPPRRREVGGDAMALRNLEDALERATPMRS